MKESYKILSKKEKLDYIWDYYKLHIFAGIFIFFMFCLFINNFFLNPTPTTYVNFSFYKGVANGGQESIELFTDYLTEDVAKQDGNFRVLSQVYPEYPNESMYSVASEQKFVVTLAAKDTDFIVTNKEKFDQMISKDVFLDLSTILSDEQMKKYHDDLYYVKTADGSEKAMGIKTTNNVYFQKANIDGSESYIGIPQNSKRIENVKKIMNAMYP